MGSSLPCRRGNVCCRRTQCILLDLGTTRGRVHYLHQGARARHRSSLRSGFCRLCNALLPHGRLRYSATPSVQPTAEPQQVTCTTGQGWKNNECVDSDGGPNMGAEESECGVSGVGRWRVVVRTADKQKRGISASGGQLWSANGNDAT